MGTDLQQQPVYVDDLQESNLHLRLSLSLSTWHLGSISHWEKTSAVGELRAHKRIDVT